MDKKDSKKEVELEENITDNLAEDMPKDENADNLADELAQMKDAYLRLMAEYDNFRKRTIKEKADLIKNGGEKVLSGLLPLQDDFQRALENIDKSKDIEPLKEGVNLIYNKFQTFLQQNGVKPIEDIGQTFDPELHEAVAMIPAENEEQKGSVVDSVQTGYTLNEKVIRHAKVVVAN
ncbi:nucleotide exchange factor GrpE [Bacteroidales bacterium OttesenSCG-928-M11]|nr:nucleotide exchange factor GrpE [Bacteroidales bacterium OttesenSCG-928-M11]